MSTTPSLEQELFDVGNHLAIGSSPVAPRQSGRRLLLLAAAVVLMLATLLVVAPTRRAIAQFFGVGAVQIQPVQTTLPGGDGTTITRPAAQNAPASFRILEAPEPLLERDIDPNVGMGMVILRYANYTVFEVTSPDSAIPLMAKLTPPGSRVEFVKVRGVDAVWITGQPHQVVMVNNNFSFIDDTVRTVGDVLLWYENGVTIRIEGAATLARARAFAESLR